MEKLQSPEIHSEPATLRANELYQTTHPVDACDAFGEDDRFEFIRGGPRYFERVLISRAISTGVFRSPESGLLVL